MGHEKPELSKKNKYWIPKEKYYELLHFCRQYDDYRHELADILELYPKLLSREVVDETNDARAIENLLHRSEKLRDKMDLIEHAAIEADADLVHWLFLGVTRGYSYAYLSTRLKMPAGKDMYYDRYRKFFYLLSQVR